MTRSFLAAGAVLLVASALQAQITGDIRGTLTDPAEAAISNAKLSLTNLETGARRVTMSDAAGRFNFNLLVIGGYEITAEAPGFRRATIRTEVRSSEISTANLKLEVGAVNEEVTVTDAPPLLDVQSAQAQASYSSQQVHELPVARNPNNIAATLPGVMPAIGGFNSGSFFVNGNRARANNITIDNITATDVSVAGTGSSNNQVLNFSSIKEVKVITNNFSAEFGRNSGAQVQYITKSGTNEVHGEAYEYLRNDKLNARDWFDRTGKPAITRNNQFGGVIGGPVIRNKTHYFLATELNPIRGAGGARIANVPTASMMARVTDPTSKKLLDQYQLPAATTDLGTFGNVQQNASSFTDAYQYSARFDHQIASNDNIYGRFAKAYNEGTSANNTFIGTNLANFGAVSTNTSYSVNLNETHIFGPTVVNEFRAGFGRTSPVFAVSSTVPLGPRIQFANGQVNTFGSWDGGPQGRVQNTFQYSDTLSWMTGAHSIRLGGDFYRYQGNSFFDLETRGIYSFNNWDDFAAGRPNTYQQRYGGTVRGHRTWIQSGFFQDDYRLTQTLTLNLGFRMEVFGPVSEVNGLSSNIDFNCRQSMGIAGSGPLGCITTGLNTTSTNYYWQPRIGFAWNPGKSRNVIRGGYGMVSDFNFLNPISNQRALIPFVVTPSITGVASFTGGNTWANLIAGTAPVQTQSLAQVGKVRTDVLNYGDVNPVIDPKLKNPQVHHWSFGVQREVVRGLVVKAGYVGTKSNFLQRARQINLNGNRLAPATSIAGETARAADFRANYNAMTTTPDRFNSRLDPRYGFVNYYDNSANSNFHAFELLVNRAFKGGYSAQFAFTRSKSIDDVSDALTAVPNDSTLIQDPRNASANRAQSGFNVPWRAVISHVWEVPFGKNLSNPTLRRIAAGWGFSGITSTRPGLPVSFTAGPRHGVANISTVTTGGLVRPNAAGAFAFEPRPAGSPGVPSTLDNPSSATPISAYASRLGLSQPLLGNFGALGRNTHRLNGVTDFSWNFFKNIEVNERFRVQLRGEFYNLFNHHSFQDVTSVITSPAFGTYTTPGQTQRVVQLGAVVQF